MAVYVEKYDGYIADNPIIDFVRCDGRVFFFDEVNTSGFTNGSEALTITGGQGAFPLAYLDTQKTLEFTFDISNFDMEMFEVANAASITEGDFGIVETARYDVATGLKVTIPYECQAGSVKVPGFEEAQADAEGKFVVTITAATANAAGSTEVVFHTGDVAIGDTLRVSYKRRMVNAAQLEVKTTTTTSKGTLYAHYPVYSSGSDCSQANVKAYMHIFIPRVRATTLPGVSSTYKGAQTYSVTFSGMDPKRADKKMWDIYYEPLDAEGNIVNKSGNTVNWN